MAIDVPDFDGSEHSEPAAGGLTERIAALVSDADRTAYKIQQRGLAVSTSLGYQLWRNLLRPGSGGLTAEAASILGKRFEDLLDRDYQYVEEGYYPRALLYQFPLLQYLRALPEAILDMPRVLLRRFRNRYSDLPTNVRTNGYPPYYLRNFHWQSDGWLSDRSARLYDAGVEFLFGGTADVMRRMAIPPVVDAAADVPHARVLDVGCGTGRYLLQLGRALPDARLYGLDLSPNYLRRARDLLARHDDVSFVKENAEAMPWADGYFDVVTSIYLFHELPPRARRTVVGEMKRVLKPGGCLVICDSVQVSDSPELEGVLRAFPKSYHEPYYENYLDDDLAMLVGGEGLQLESTLPHLLSKVVVAVAPDD